MLPMELSQRLTTGTDQPLTHHRIGRDGASISVTPQWAGILSCMETGRGADKDQVTVYYVARFHPLSGRYDWGHLAAEEGQCTHGGQ